MFWNYFSSFAKVAWTLSFLIYRLWYFSLTQKSHSLTNIMRVLSELYCPQFVIAASRPSVLIWVVILLSKRGFLSSTSPLAFQHLEIRQVVRLSQSVWMNVLERLYILPTSKRSVRRGRMQAEQQGGWCQEEGERTPRCPTPPLWHFSQPWNSTWNWTTYTVVLCFLLFGQIRLRPANQFRARL